MRRKAAEKMEIIRMVEDSDLPAKQTLRMLNIPSSTFYGWYKRYVAEGFEGLSDKKPKKKPAWNRIPEKVQKNVVKLALQETALSPRELACRFTDQKAYFVSESSVYRILKARDLITSPAYILMQAADAFQHPTRRVHELWQTDFTHLKVIGWGWYYLSTVLDDYSRYIISWKLSPTMGATDVQDTLDIALSKAKIVEVHVRHRPRLLSDNGPAYLSGQLREYLSERGMKHTRGAPYHPMTQGKIERWHRSMKNVVKLENYYSPCELRRAIEHFVDYYNNERYHESLNNVTPADVYFGRYHSIISERERIKKATLERRKRAYFAAKAA